MQRPLDLAVLGCGAAAALHSRVLRRIGGVRLHYASRSLARAEALRARFGGERAYGSYAEALEGPGVDAVLVVTPPARHLEQTLSALDAGKDVIVEKPAFLDAEAFARVREAAGAARRRVFVAENYVYKPLAERLRSVLSDGLIGEPLMLHVNAVKRQRASGWRADVELTGGGGLLEGGIHWISLMANLGLEVVDVTGYPALRDPVDRAERGTEETVLVVMRYQGGAVGSLAFSWEVPSPLRGVRISYLYGTEGSVRFESNGIFVLVQGRRTRLHVPGFRDIAGYRGMWRDFLHSMRAGVDPRMTLDIAERDVHWVRRAYSRKDEK